MIIVRLITFYDHIVRYHDRMEHVDPSSESSSATGSTAFGPITWEPLPWRPTFDVEALSRRARKSLPDSYDAAVPVQIAGCSFSLSTALAADVEDATAAVVNLDNYVTNAVGEDHDIAPMQTVLLRSESAASSQIENLTVGANQLAIGGAASGNAEMVSRNVKALRAAIRLAGKLDAASILAMHEALLGGQDPRAGHWREVQVWIGSSRLSPAGAAFVPPQPSRVSAYMHDLAVFLARDDLPVLLHAALAHAQFETVHPFTDGNGRTGRALLQAMLRRGELTRRVTIPISAGLLTDTASYFAALMTYRDGDIVPIVQQLCQASRAAALHGRWLIDELAHTKGSWLETVRPRAGSTSRSLLGMLVGQPAITVAWVQEQLGVSNTAARRAVDQLTAAGVITETTDRRRNRVFVARDVIDILDEFAARAGHRG